MIIQLSAVILHHINYISKENEFDVS